MSKSTLKKLLPAASSVFLFALADHAVAQSSSCFFSPSLPGIGGTGKCETGEVQANPDSHFIFFEVSPNANYTLKDVQTRVSVASGTAGMFGKRKTVFGLYGSYKLFVDNPVIGGYGYINNN